jgi:hypothetical protein
MRACLRVVIFSLIPTLSTSAQSSQRTLSALLIARSPNHNQGAR